MLTFLADGGTCGALARSVDWNKTSLGPPETWPHGLRATVSIILRSRHPMFLWWGPELVQFYNDAYLPSFGKGKHPAAMGQRGRDCWQEIWPIIWPQIDDVMSRGKASWNEDHLVPIWRNGRIEEVYWTYGYSPVLDDSGSIGGTLVVCTETTNQVLAARRALTLSRLSERTAHVDDIGELMSATAAALASSQADTPFGLFYGAASPTKERPVLASFGLTGDSSLDVADKAARAHLLSAQAEAPPPEQRVVALDLGALRTGPWPEPCSEVLVAPLGEPGQAPSMGFVVLGLSPRLGVDQTYLSYLAQVSLHVSSAAARIGASHLGAAVKIERNNLLLRAPVATALLTGPHHVFQLANELFCRMVGRTSIVGKAYVEAFPELVGTPLPSILDRVYATGEPFVTNEYRVPLDATGQGVVEDHFFKFNLEPLRDPSGNVSGMMAVAVDVTEQVRSRLALEKTHAERERLLDQAESASRAKDEFMAMLGHELRNPLSPIVTALRLMKLKGEASTSKERAVIERQVQHLTRLVDDLLDVSKITRGKITLRKETVEMAAVIDRAIEIASVLFEERSHTLTVSVPRAGLLWTGDPTRLAQAVANLLTNAARYTSTGGEVSVRAHRDESTIAIVVKDNGVGIAPEMLPLIFDLFVQERRSNGRSEGGLGLGLTLVKSLVTLHGGHVEARSEGPGTGSEFTITVPAAAEDAVLLGATEATNETPQAPVGPSKRILVVDDNGDAAVLLAAALRAAGHEVTVATDPAMALTLAASFRPQIAVLDIGLPVMDGYELGLRLRENVGMKGCRLIALTGYGQEHDHAKSRAAGFHAHMVKPVDVDALLQAVKE